jgi:hypothetical protein
MLNGLLCSKGGEAGRYARLHKYGGMGVLMALTQTRHAVGAYVCSREMGFLRTNMTLCPRLQGRASCMTAGGYQMNRGPQGSVPSVPAAR